MRDFTLKIYTKLLQSFQANGYEFISFADYCRLTSGTRNEERGKEKSDVNDELLIINDHHADVLPEKFVILRHDVDLKAENSFKVASCELRVTSSCKASYYFRTLPSSNKPEIIKEIAAMGHEVGYHYEDMSLCGGDPERAVEHFKKWLDYFRAFYPVKTVCMHGAPTSKYDSKDIWKFTTREEHGLIGEPYYDTDWEDVFYITDTGRRWDGWKVSVRDRIHGHQERWIAEGLVYKTTEDIIRAVQNGTFPKRVMMTTHPQRWDDGWGAWVKELFLQNMKNILKKVLIKLKGGLPL